MAQRNPMNERYTDENRKGKTRKSAASAKPSSSRAATVHTPPPKSKKQKQKEAREREQKREEQYRAMAVDAKRFEDTDEYKKLRRIWWVCLAVAIVCVGVAYVFSRNEDLQALYVPFVVVGWVLVIGAFVLDLGVIRKKRRQYEATLVLGKSKEARAAQKKARAEVRAQQKEAEEKFDEAKAAEAEKKSSGFLARFRKPAPEEPAPDSSTEEQEDSSK